MNGVNEAAVVPIHYHVVVVNYGKSEAILKLLDQLGRQTVLPGSVCIIDNSPETLALPKDVGLRSYPFSFEVQYTPENLGYARACNLGAKITGWNWLVLLNPDIEIGDAVFFEKLLAQSAELPQLGCVGVAQQNPDTSYELVARRFPTLLSILGKRVPFLGRSVLKSAVRSYLESYPNGFDEKVPPFSVDWLQSSFLLVPKAAWQACGGLDERYFVFMSDTDFGRRCIKAGLKSWFMPGLKIQADGVRSSGGGVMDVFRKRTIRIHLADAMRYFL